MMNMVRYIQKILPGMINTVKYIRNILYEKYYQKDVINEHVYLDCSVANLQYQDMLTPLNIVPLNDGAATQVPQGHGLAPLHGDASGGEQKMQ